MNTSSSHIFIRICISLTFFAIFGKNIYDAGDLSVVNKHIYTSMVMIGKVAVGVGGIGMHAACMMHGLIYAETGIEHHNIFYFTETDGELRIE